MRKLSLSLVCLAVLAGGCSAPKPADPFTAFLQEIEGEWVGVLTETAALDKKVVREMPMRLTIGPDGSTVEYPILACSGVLRAPPEGTPPPTETEARFMLVIEPAGISPCMSGLVKITRVDDALRYVFLGDTLRRVRAALVKRI